MMSEDYFRVCGGELGVCEHCVFLTIVDVGGKPCSDCIHTKRTLAYPSDVKYLRVDFTKEIVNIDGNQVKP